MSQCCICLDTILNNNTYKCSHCNNIFHHDCILQLKKNICPLCRNTIIINNNTKYNITFNNMTDNNNFNLNQYIQKWSDKKCLQLNHNFKLETLGDWDFDSELIFKFRFMHIECLDCKKNIII